MNDFIKNAPIEWGKFLGIRAESSAVPIVDFEHIEIYIYE